MAIESRLVEKQRHPAGGDSPTDSRYVGRPTGADVMHPIFYTLVNAHSSSPIRKACLIHVNHSRKWIRSWTSS